MSRRRNPLRTCLTAAACAGFAWLTQRLPLSCARFTGRALAWAAYYLVPHIRKAGLANLTLAYGDTLSRREKVRILRQAVQNSGIVAAEFSRIPLFCAGKAGPWVDFEGLEQIDRSRGALLLGAHLGNWEWMGPALVSKGYAVAEVVRPLDSPRLDALVETTRRSGNVTLITKDRAASEMVRLLRAGCLVGLLVDQSPRENGVPVRFFGQQTWATAGPALAWARTRVPVHPVAMTRQPGDRYTLRIGPEIPTQRSGNLRADLLANTQRCQDAIEDLVRLSPEQWLWFHRRWKPRPRLEREWQTKHGRKT